VSIRDGKPDNPPKLKRLQVDVSEEAHRVCKMAATLYRMTMAEVVDAALRHYAIEFKLDKELSGMVFKAMYPGAEEKAVLGRK
jgi:hypothetical protein